jgi:hypothetical protein
VEDSFIIQGSISRHASMMYGVNAELGTIKEAYTGGILQSSKECRSTPLMKSLDPMKRGKPCFEELCTIDGDFTEAKAKKGRLEGEVPNNSVLAVASQQPR